MHKILKTALVLPAAGAALFTEELYRYLFCRNSSALFTKLFDTKGHEEAYYVWRDERAARQRAARQQVFTMKLGKGEERKGFYFPNGADGKKIAFVVHGYRSEHAETAGVCLDYYRSRGIDVFCCDHVASGESQGRFIGFDVLETRDCLRWVDFLVEHFGADTQIILHGFSMGAATVLQMSSHCPENVKFIVEDSGFISARAALRHQIGPMYQPMRVLNRAIAGYDLDDSDVTESLAKATLPILFVHGRDDMLVPFENGPALYERYQGEKDCFFPENTRHIESMYTCPEEYARKLDGFAARFLTAPEEQPV